MVKIVERSARMGAADLAKAANSAQGMTIGFEFEVATPNIDQVKYDPRELDELVNDYISEWVPPSIDTYVGSLIDQHGFQYLIDHYQAEPHYGWEEDGQTVYDIDNGPVNVSSIGTVNELDDLFSYDYEQLELDYENMTSNKLTNDVSAYKAKLQHNNGGDPLYYIAQAMEPLLAKENIIIHTVAHASAKNNNQWYIEPDVTIKPSGGELVSPPMALLTGLVMLEKVLNLIRKDPEMETNASTGLHINMGIPNPENIDLLKLTLLMGETHILDTFNRAGNDNTSKLLPSYVTYLKDQDLHNLDQVISDVNAAIRQNAQKMKTINIGKLSKGYLEFRASGGDYSTKFKEVKDTALRYARAIMLASDPNAERQAYLKKLYTLTNSPENILMPVNKRPKQ